MFYLHAVLSNTKDYLGIQPIACFLVIGVMYYLHTVVTNTKDYLVIRPIRCFQFSMMSVVNAVGFETLVVQHTVDKKSQMYMKTGVKN